MLGVVVLGFVAAGTMGACAGDDPAPGECAAPDPEPPVEEPSTACAEPVKPCMLYRIQLQGDPTNIAADRAKYKAAFGSACYVAAANNSFNCYFKDLKTACDNGFLVPKVYGAAEYEGNFPCVPDGNGIWSRQVGSDPAVKMYVFLENAPVETSLIDVDGIPTEINGPYRNLPQLTTVKVGGGFDCKTGIPGPDGGTLEQRQWILQVNRNGNDGGIRSDLAGFEYPCKDECGKLTKCTEPEFLKEPDAKHRDAARVHHVVRRTDLRGCDWGTNANSNAAVISRGLNGHLYNNYPLKKEVEQINKVPPYTYTP
jgi:hypothetical protein